jgi:glycosyltransferase involved in cell wall biosynthesis
MTERAASVELSVVIPSRNCARELPRQLDALAAQQFEYSWEIVVADNGSTDGSANVASSFAGRIPNLRIVNASTTPGRQYACNVGAHRARGRLLVFVDADDAVAPGYLNAMARALDTHAVAAARLDHSLDPSWMRNVGSDVQTNGLQNGFSFLLFGCGASLGFRRYVFCELGGFNEKATLCEDVDICWRAQLAGYSIRFVEDAVLGYRSRATIRAMYRQHRDYARSWPYLYRQFRGAGMPRRSLRMAAAEWRLLARAIPKLRTRNELARWARRAGRSVGRVEGSVRHRAWYP